MLNRLTKDIDTLDNTLADALRMLISTIAGVVGTIVLIAIVQNMVHRATEVSDYSRQSGHLRIRQYV